MSEKDVEIENEGLEDPSTEEQVSVEVTGGEDALTEAEQKAQENWDKLVRIQAEMENLRRRHERDLENAHKFALEKFAIALLPIIDSLEMGIIASNNDGTTVEALKEGSELTLKMFIDTLTKFGVESIHPENDPFNPDLHQAMAMVESHEHDANTVMNVMQKGYLLNERLIRPAMVTVTKPPVDAQSASDGDTSDEKGANLDEKA